MKKIIFLVILFFNYSAYAEINLEANTTGIWSITPTAQQNRWLIIHNLTEAQTTGIYHIEVIGRDKKSPVWQIQHLAPHIAINKPALLSSIIKPLKKGDVYPESFDNAFTVWQKENNGKGGAICTTSVIECMK
jgi:Domain of unknown function (DUF5086)